jgi:UDP-hydrolysing UDP-N-acetyl-D-glucosamine 2-epimerase
MSKRTIAIFTGNRAEYGLQFPIIRAIAEHPALDYRLLVSGAHLDEDFGRTSSEIESDGFMVAAQIKIEMSGDRVDSTALAISSGVLAMSEYLRDNRPDLLLVYADRFEGFAAVIAGSQMNIPTAHIEGGDITEGGALDDSVRHAMTKLAHLHFTTNEQASNRIRAMGEENWRVHTAGFPVIDLIKQGAYATPAELAARYDIDPAKPLVMFTQHSVTTEFEQAGAQISPALSALERLAEEGVQILLTYPNNDSGGRLIIERIDACTGRGLPGIRAEASLGRHNYHGVLALALDRGRRIVCAGNSSSGIKETPAFGCPTVNIGSRQQGRLRGDNVVDADYDAEAIYQALRLGLDDEAFRNRCAATENPYGKGNSGKIIADVLREVDLDPHVILRKGMTLKGLENDGWYR